MRIRGPDAGAAWLGTEGRGGVFLGRTDQLLSAIVGDRWRLCVPKTSSTSCDQAIFVDQATDASPFTDAVLAEIDRLG